MSLGIAAGVALAYSGLASISVTMDRHHADIHGRGSAPERWKRVCFRLLGWTAITLAFFACIFASGWHIGPVLWCGVMTATSIVLTLLLHYVPQKAIFLAKIGYLAAPILMAGLLLH